jgi:hypothetical protein
MIFNSDIYVFIELIEAGGPIYAYQQTPCSGFNTRIPAGRYSSCLANQRSSEARNSWDL